VVVIEPMPDRSPESVWVAVSGLVAGAPVVIDWGDGWRYSVSSGCSTDQAASGQRSCQVRARHAYAKDGTYTVTASTPTGAPLAAANVASVRSVPQGDRSWRRAMLQEVNRLRAEAGVPALRACFRLTRSATSYAATMANRNHYGHIGPDGSDVWQRAAAAGYRGSVTAENIGAGQRSVGEVMTDWRESESHYRALIDPAYTHIGFGYLAAFHARHATYWVQHLGRGGECK
jgi:uncharacterized protein YkwD